MKLTKLDTLNRDAQGNIVLRVAHYTPATHMQVNVSVYAYKGIKAKRMSLLVRTKYPRGAHSLEELRVIKENLAHLWAMQHDVSNYVIVYGGVIPEPRLFHPTQLENQP